MTDTAHTLRSLQVQTGLPRLEFHMLWEHVLGVSRAWLIAHDTDALTPEAVADFRGLAQRREAGEPMAYLLGWREFMDHRFDVTPEVLIPRPETELLVACALEAVAARPGARILELGTGSGAVAISLALARPDAQVVATDVSQGALAVAQGNAARLRANVQWYAGSWYDVLPAGMAFDAIVSNPPYIAADDAHLQQGDVRFEPRLALTDGADGLQACRAIVAGARRWLNAGGALFVEHGWDQAGAVRELLHQARFEQVESRPDLAGTPRVSGGVSAISLLEEA